MQLINAVVNPSRVNDIVDALQTFGFRGVTAIEAVGFGKRRGASRSIAAPGTAAATGSA